ncbi:MAG TPA: ACP S-malonyltransferase [Thermoleophilaceae bacterium]|jgi:acyl transferase domain-containing protein
MREDVQREAPFLIDVVCEAVGADPFERVGAGTRYVQPAIFARSVASWLALRDHVDPVAFAGHSMGEIAAFVAAGAIDVEDGARIVAARGVLTAEVAAGTGMMALLGVAAETSEAIVARRELTVASYNAHDQIVAAGPRTQLAGARAEVEALGGKGVELAIGGAFHSRALESALPRFLDVVRRVRFRQPDRPVVSSVTGEPFTCPARQLGASLVEPVRWPRAVQWLHAAGARHFVEAAPGNVLSRLIRTILPGVTAEPAAKLLAREAANSPVPARG